MTAAARFESPFPVAARPSRGPTIPATVSEPRVARSAGSARELNGILTLLTCGSVDDGKSTLIGRLLFDASDLYDDQRATIERSRLVGSSGQPDFSLLVDGLAAEREQGITIDIAWRYFDTARRRFVVIDSPGHEQYTRNMASGASHADVAIMLVDARAGLKVQTRRHAAILNLMGVRRVVLAVNKMDLVRFDQVRFDAIKAEFDELVAKLGFVQAIAIPLVATTGDNIATASRAMPWYEGPTLLQHLDALPSRVTETGGPFRMPVQSVLRDGVDFRGLAGTVASGTVCVGDKIVDVLSGQSSRVLRLATLGRDLEFASAGQAVAIQLEHDLDISRGAVLSAGGVAPAVATRLDVRMVWLDAAPFDVGARYLLRTATDLVPVSTLAVTALLDLATLETAPSIGCGMNDIALARLNLGRPTAIDLFAALPKTGCFMLVDAVTGASVAGGVVVAVTAVQTASVARGAKAGFVLTRSLLAAGLCADLGHSPNEQVEFKRRAREVAALFAAAGLSVVLEL